MTNKDFDIDEKILGILNGNMDSTDKMALEEWVSRSIEHERDYQEKIRELRRVKIAVSSKQAQEMVQRIRERMERLARRRRMVRYLRMTSVVASLLLLIGMGRVLYERMTHLPEGDNIVMVEPGAPKAYLELENGELLDLLVQKRNSYIPELSATIDVDSSVLKYGGDSTANSFHKLIVPKGGEYTIVLSDGTKVYMNAGSELRYPVNFEKYRREVFLSGEAYFEVAKMTEAPFTVHVGDIDIEVLGTSFNANAYPESSCVLTTLEEGQVQVGNKKQRRVIVPGEQCSYDKKTKQLKVEMVDTELFTSWRNGYYYFNRTPLETIFGTLSLWYDVEIEYEDSKLKQIRFSGKLKRFEDIEQLLDKFERTKNVSFVLKGKKIIVKKHRE